MNYTEWRDELKDNLLSVSESERRRVLEYYAEAYADRREAGFSEREIIAGFGAPYDAAQRILNEGGESGEGAAGARRAPAADDPFPEARPNYEKNYDEGTPPPPPAPAPALSDNTGRRVLFIVLCIIFAAPIFGIIMALVGITIGLVVAPFAVLASGVGAIISGIGSMIVGDLYYGLFTLATGMIVFGVGVILMSVFTRLIKFLWWAWSKGFNFVKSLFLGRAKA